VSFAAWRFPVSIRHDVVIPVLVIVGLWITAAWYYHLNTYPDGAIKTPDQAVAAIRQKCGGMVPTDLMNRRMRAKLQDGKWFTYLPLIDYSRLRTYGALIGAVDAKTGEVTDCILQNRDF